MERPGYRGVSIVKDEKVVFAKGYGVKTAGGSEPIGTNTAFQIGSTSKAFTDSLSREVESGRMNWSDPVVRYLPDLRMSDPWITKEFTLTDSLAQRSGPGEKWGQDLATLGYNRSELIRALLSPPRSEHRQTHRTLNALRR
jgi:CubicO group peptidase (beta-lactamase class C family)